MTSPSSVFLQVLNVFVCDSQILWWQTLIFFSVYIAYALFVKSLVPEYLVK